MKNQIQHQYSVNETTLLLPFLLDKLSRGRNQIKALLARGQVLVDGEVETAYNYNLVPGQQVTILKQAQSPAKQKGLTIMYEDDDLIVINKSAGLLTIATGKQPQETAYRELTAHVRRKNPKARIFIVHRLDRDTSGVMVFAKNEKTKLELQDNWKDVVAERTYVALVEGKVRQPNGTITSWLKETKTHQMYVSETSKGAKKAVLNYEKLQSNKHFTLMKVQLDTGRKNQIRVQLAHIGHPIVGDKKYRAQTNGIGRLGLHAEILSFVHPKTKELLTFKADAPASFIQKSKG